MALKNLTGSMTLISCVCRPPASLRKPVRLFMNDSSKTKWTNFRQMNKAAGIWVLGVASGCLLYSKYRHYFHDFSNELNHMVPEVSASSVTGGDQRKTMNFIADVSEHASPAVVYLEVQGRNPFHGRMTPVGNGSGFIVREDGLILTNAHVVANKQKLIIRMQDGRSFEGRVQAVDPVSDLATVKINAKDLPILHLGDSTAIRPGEWVIAMGSPFQLSNTVTAGIVSTVHRGSKELGIHNRDMDYIQTDAVINFGNSGGPLVNLDGEAIGINTMKVTTGISFAIPSDYAKKFLSRAKQVEHSDGKQSRPSWFGFSGTAPNRRYVGITMLTLTQRIIMELRSRQDSFPEVEHGVLVHKLVIGSPAFSGGVQVGDVIVNINGKAVKSASDVYKAVEKDTHLNMIIKRGLDTIHVTVTPEEV